MESFWIEYSEEQDLHAKADRLLIFLKECQELISTDQSFFIKILRTIPDLFETFVRFGSKNIKDTGDKEYKEMCLESSKVCLEAILQCLSCQKSLEEQQLVLSTTTRILKLAYTHCAESELLYGESLLYYTEQLAVFFNVIQNVQSIMIEEMDKLFSIDVKEIDHISFSSIIIELQYLTDLVFNLDPFIGAKLWRVFLKIISHFPSIASSILDTNQILCQIMLHVTEMTNICVSSLEGENRFDDSVVKIILFLINLLLKFFDVFNATLEPGKIAENICNVLLKLWNMAAITYSYSILQSTDDHFLMRSLLNAILSTSHLYTDEICIHLFNLNINGVSEDHKLALFILKLKAADNIVTRAGKLLAYCTAENLKIIFKVLQSLSPEHDFILVSSHASLQLQISVHNSENNNSISQTMTVYQQAYLILGEYVKHISDSDIAHLENEIGEISLLTSDICFLLISDIWTLRMRCSSCDFLYNRLSNLSIVFYQTKPNMRLKQLLKRLFKFLPVEYRDKLMNEDTQLYGDICGSLKVCNRYGIPKVSKCLGENQDVVKIILLLVKELRKPTSPTSLQRAVELSCLLLHETHNFNVSQLIQLSDYAFEKKEYDVQVIVLTFLRAVSNMAIARNDSEAENKILAIASLLSKSLRCKNYIVRYEALNAYASIAQSTPHQRLLRHTVTMCPSLVPIIKSFFLKLPEGGFLSDTQRIQHLQKLLNCNNKENNLSCARISTKHS